jgi:BirA family biotin operon repressor/biotin-[acetyl-CoA-carboxylase] ligase
MNRPTLQETLSDLPLGPVRYYKTIDSTNLAAAQWVLDGASHFSLVVADEQTAGRGRHGRRWFTPPGSALAFSLIIKSERLSLFQDKQDGLDHVPSLIPSRLTALGALAVCESLQTQFGLNPQIKWPNDVLVNKCKVAGVLVEAQWQSRLLAAILGIGINIAPASIPADKDLTFPATSVETVLGEPVYRWILLHEVLASIVRWQQRLSSKEFIQTWEELLAFKGEWVQVVSEKRQEDNPENIREGQVLGLSDEGALKLQAPSGERFEIQIGELQLRPVKG